MSAERVEIEIMSDHGNAGESAAATPQSSKPAMPAYRIVLLAVLAVALVLLAIDQTARFKAKGAYASIARMVSEEEDLSQPASNIEGPRTPTEIQKMLGRAPDNSEQRRDELLETYGWRGVFNSYTVYVVYNGATLVLEEGEVSEPMLAKVGFNAEP